jgi:hypothetical protein
MRFNELFEFFQGGHTEQLRWKKCKVSMMCIACPGLEPATKRGFADVTPIIV